MKEIILFLRKNIHFNMNYEIEYSFYFTKLNNVDESPVIKNYFRSKNIVNTSYVADGNIVIVTAVTGLCKLSNLKTKLLKHERKFDELLCDFRLIFEKAEKIKTQVNINTDYDEQFDQENFEHILCKICYSNRARYAFIKCKHFGLCSACFEGLNNKRCPFCRSVSSITFPERIKNSLIFP